MRSMRALMVLGVALSYGPALAAAEKTTIAKGTSVDLILRDDLSTQTAKVGDVFHATPAPPVGLDQPLFPEGTVVVGRVESVKSVRNGHVTGVLGVKFTHIQLPDGEQRSIDGELTEWRHDDHKPLAESAPLVSTGRKPGTVFIGESSMGRASTLVGEDRAEAYAKSGLGTEEVIVARGTEITMEFAAALTDVRVARSRGTDVAMKQ